MKKKKKLYTEIKKNNWMLILFFCGQNSKEKFRHKENSKIMEIISSFKNGILDPQKNEKFQK